MNSRRVQYYGFEANGVEVQLYVDVRMRQKAGTQTTKIKSAKSFEEVHPRKFIPSKYTRYTVSQCVMPCHTTCVKRPHLKWPTTTIIKTVWLITYIVQAHLVVE